MRWNICGLSCVFTVTLECGVLCGSTSTKRVIYDHWLYVTFLLGLRKTSLRPVLVNIFTKQQGVS